jgi:hypothetical protein
MKRGMPWLQFYPADWLSDAVSGCSPAAKGIWIDMLCVMHASQRYGYLEAEGKPIPDEFMFRRCGCASVEQYRNLLAELFYAGVPSRTPEGVIYSRRMVRDEKERSSTAARVRRFREKRSCNADVTPQKSEIRSQRSEVREKQNPTAKPAPLSVSTHDPLERETKEAGFSVFWEKWPVHQARQTAFRAWLKIPISEYAAIMQGLEKWSVSDQWIRGVIPHASTWLNQKRWQDEDVPAKGGSNGKSTLASIAKENWKGLGLDRPIN